MATSRADAVALFSDVDDGDEDDPDTEAGRRHQFTKIRALEQAVWCMATGQPPAVYLSCTRDEREAFLEVVARRR